MMDITWEDFDSRFWRKVAIDDGCWEWLGWKNSDGYGKIERRGKKHSLHRAMWHLMRGPIPDGLHVLHHCDNPGCVRPGHLFLGTHSDNMQDMWNKRRHPEPRGGHDHPVSKLSAEDVVEIRELLKTPMLQKDIAAKFGVCKQTITNVKQGKHYAE